MPVKAVKTAQEPQQANKLYFEAQKEREILERSLEICRAYQENTKRSEQLQTDILKGIQAGEGFYSLFLKAVKTISIMTSNPVFYTQAEADTRTIHGKALGQPEPIREQIEETRRRLHRVQEALEREDDPGSREQLRRSVAAHKARIAELEQTIKQ